MSTMEERRKAKRYPVPYPVEKQEEEGNRILSVVDVSKSGAAFTDTSELKENEEVKLQVFLKKKRFDLRALVVRAKKIKDDIYNMGVKFLYTPDDFVKTLEKELEQITQHHRESNLYKHKDLSFRTASEEYLNKKPWEEKE